MNKKYYSFLLAVFMIILPFQPIHSQSKWSINPGVYYNGGGIPSKVNGVGVVAGLDYMPAKVFSIELRTKYGFYEFNDGTKWTTDSDGNEIPPKNPNEARVDYKTFSPQIGLVPKFYIRFSDVFSIILENEAAVGFMTGKYKYKGISRKEKFTEPVFCYNGGIGLSYKEDDWEISMLIGYSTLNFRDNIKEHQPTGYRDKIPNQDSPIYFKIQFKVPLRQW